MDLSALLSDWSFEPQIVLPLILSAVLYAFGYGYMRRRGLGRHLRWWQVVAFYGGLLAVFVALESPIDGLAETYFWVHMLQHELLVIAAAPLLLLGAPLWPLWRAFPRGARRATLGWVVRQGWPRRWWHAISGVLGAPLFAWLAFVITFTIWHLPALYDVALEYEPIHIAEHLLFLGTALLFWAQIIPSRPIQPKLGYVGRSAYAIGAAIEMNILAFALAIAPSPSYAPYADLPRAPGMISALVDQHAAAGVMDVPSTIIFFALVMALLGFWLRDDERTADERARALVGAHTQGTHTHIAPQR
jgi:cytochrome c oxidase assembly factor CtaG